MEDESCLPIIPTKCCNVAIYLHDLLPKRLKRVCIENRKDRATRKAHKYMATEINIIEIVKWIRYSRMALKLLMTKKEQIQTEERCRYIIIDPKSSDEDENIRRVNS